MSHFVNVASVAELQQANRLAQRAPQAHETLTNAAIAAVAMLVTIAFFLAENSACAHWFLLPLWVCGALTGSDVVAWLRRHLETFDPKAIIGILWFHNTCLAPLLHVAREFHNPLFDSQVQDWRDSFGWMACVNSVALILYKLGQRWALSRTSSVRSLWRIETSRFQAVLALALVASFIASAVVLFRYGGLRKDFDFLGDPRDVAHLSWLLMLGDSFFVLLMLALVRLLWRVRSLAAISGLLALQLIGQWLLLGMRGSRGAVIMALFIGAGFCHYRLRRIPLSLLLAGTIVFGMSGYYYAFFKRFGTSGLEAIRNPEYRQTLAHQSGITPLGVVLGDLSRAEIQAFILHQIVDETGDYQLRMGKTYLTAGMMLIPRGIWPSKPSEYLGKVAAGTDLQFGAGSFRPERFESSLVYGLGGEAMLNFGVIGVPFAYFVFGIMLGWYRKKKATLDADDARWYLVPVVTLTAITAAFGDADNTVFLFLKFGGLLVTVITLTSIRLRSSWQWSHYPTASRAQTP